MSTKTTYSEGRGKASVPPKKAAPSRRGMMRKRHGLRPGVIAVVIAAVAIVTLAAIFFHNAAGTGGSSTTTNQAGQYAFQVGKPGPGEQAPSIELPSTTGGTFDLASMRGKTALLYFQEGLTCQPCWDQLKDMQSHISQFKALGIDQIVSITTDPLDALQQKVADEGIIIPVLSDPRLAVSSAYTANGYGMMGSSRDGHTFIVVGPDGMIKWRADYGGAPNYTMYVPVSNLVADIRAGLKGTSS